MGYLGFFIREIRIKGVDVPDAYLQFKSGTNVVCGTSDTGKSYIFTLISYVLGRSQMPKEGVPEARNYKQIYLEIETFSESKVYTLNRGLSSKKVRVLEGSILNWDSSNEDIVTYDVTNSNDHEKTISHFLLKLCGLDEKFILKSKAKAKVQRLSFKNLIQYFFVSEQNIIKEESPFYPSGQYIDRTLEQSILNLLLTGKDFSELKDVEDVTQKKLNLKAQLEYVNRRIAKLSKVSNKLSVEIRDAIELSRGGQYNDLRDQLQSYLFEVEELGTSKLETIKEKNEKTKTLNYYRDLVGKFRILDEQYNSDLERLQFIVESEHYTSQIGAVSCPVCGHDINNDYLEHHNHIENFKETVSVELAKLNSKIKDLRITIASRETDITHLEKLILGYQNSIEDIDLKIEKKYNVKIDLIKGAMDSILHAAKIQNEHDFLEKDLVRLYAERKSTQKLIDSKKSPQKNDSIVSPFDLHKLTLLIKKRLKDWNFDDKVDVIFDSDYKIFDIIVSGKSRRAFGKGRRAILYAACMFAILDYTKKEGHDFSNLIMIDSLLNPFKGKSEVAKAIGNNEVLTTTIKQRIYKDLAKYKSDCQIIIFENEIPAKSLYNKLNVQIFTDDYTQGRQGFFPKTE